jgi:hypothetical protein
MTAVWPANGSLAAPSADGPELPGSSEVVASQTVKDLTASSGLVFDDADECEPRGVAHRRRCLRVTL